VLCYRLSTTAMLVCSFGNNCVRFRRCMIRVARPDTPQLLFSYSNPHYRVPPQFRFFSWLGTESVQAYVRTSQEGPTDC
jgi:hypothetical protein